MPQIVSVQFLRKCYKEHIPLINSDLKIKSILLLTLIYKNIKSALPEIRIKNCVIHTG